MTLLFEWSGFRVITLEEKNPIDDVLVFCLSKYIIINMYNSTIIIAAVNDLHKQRNTTIQQLDGPLYCETLC